MKDGGSAFPKQPMIHTPNVGDTVYEQGGMSLRDYFAAAALPAIISRSFHDESASIPRFNHGFAIDRSPYADVAYQYADAMIQQRDKEPT